MFRIIKIWENIYLWMKTLAIYIYIYIYKCKSHCVCSFGETQEPNVAMYLAYVYVYPHTQLVSQPCYIDQASPNLVIRC